MRSANPLAYSLMACAAVLWAGNIVLGRAASAAVPPIGLSFWRWTVAFAIFLPFVAPLIRRQWPVMRREWRLKRDRRLRKQIAQSLVPEPVAA